MSDSFAQIKVNNNEFVWNKKDGLFTFDGAPALLFWDAAIELFLRTIEEVSGNDVSTTVFEATGFRMGKLVSSYYSKRLDTEEIINEYMNIYRNAGWGNVKIEYFSLEEKKVIVHLRNSWEHRIFKEMDKEQAGVLLPSHWAGVFSGLFNENMWYKINHSQLNGNEYDEIEIFASTITAAANIHNLARQKEQVYINELESKVKERTEELALMVKDLSSPIIPVLKDILVLPLIGKFTDHRFEDLNQKALFEFTARRAKYLIVDLTGISHFDEMTIYGLQRLVLAINLIGGSCILVGISPSLALQMKNAQVDLKNIKIFSTLEHGVQHALEKTGYSITKNS
ncbi:MAG: STAS domain-containing protein [Paenisporosarcina sp.]